MDDTRAMEVTPGQGFMSIADLQRISDDKGAWNFDGILAEANKEFAEEASKKPSLSVLVDGTDEPITREGVTFHPKAPKVKQTKQIIMAAKEADAKLNNNDEVGSITSVSEMVTNILYVEENGVMRNATVDEIEECFTIQEINSILSKYTGISQKDSLSGK